MYDKLKHMILEECHRNPPETAYTNCMAVFTREWVKGTPLIDCWTKIRSLFRK